MVRIVSSVARMFLNKLKRKYLATNRTAPSLRHPVMDACGSTRRGKAGKCDARLTKLFADIAPEDASRISGGKSGAASHAERLDDVSAC